jgi:ATP adenylyltransferase
MDHLWTPWRSTYMEAKKEPGVCVFCEAVRDPSDDERTLVVLRAEHCFVILNRYPYTSGHLMIVPYAHVAKLNEASREATVEMMELARRAERVLEGAYRPEGINMGLNIGAAAGAGITEHVHLHMLPRWLGDANFMTAVGNARILPEALEVTFDKVRAGFEIAG